MRQVMVRYTVKPGRAAENEELVRAVYDELAEVKPEGLRYATFRLEDGLTFVHIAFSDLADGNPLSSIKAFQKFQEGIGERCDVPPKVAELSEVGSYGFFGS
jgi:hypothetical protein